MYLRRVPPPPGVPGQHNGWTPPLCGAKYTSDHTRKSLRCNILPPVPIRHNTVYPTMQVVSYCYCHTYDFYRSAVYPTRGAYPARIAPVLVVRYPAADHAPARRPRARPGMMRSRARTDARPRLPHLPPPPASTRANVLIPSTGGARKKGGGKTELVKGLFA
jgi:hypothetical protein